MTALIDQPGIYNIPAAVYHSDPLPVPSLSASIAKELLSRSPLHAMCRHPKLARNPLRQNKEAFDLGTAAHAMVLHDGRAFEIIEAPDWRTKAAKDAREAAYAAGKTPLLEHQLGEVKQLADACMAQLADHEAHDAFIGGKSERTLIWQERDVWCRSLIDWMPETLREGSVVYDLKTTAQSAHPDSWGGRTLWNLGFDVQAAFYLRGLRAVTDIDNIRFRFVIIEVAEPWAICVVEIDQASLALAARKVERAIEMWRQCLEADAWPGYPARVCHVEIPAWAADQWVNREEREPLTPEMIRAAIDWQSPMGVFS